MFIEIAKFIFYSALIVIISKYILVTTLRKLAESLNLKAKTVGEIAGFATSVPELLTIGTSSFNGLLSASITNVFSSNVINFLQYLASVFLNKNTKVFKNIGIKINLILVAVTIIIPIVFVISNVEMSIIIVPIFIVLYVLFRITNSNLHKLYLKNEVIEENLEINKNSQKTKTIRYAIYLIVTGILLFIIGDALGDTLENLCNRFEVSQSIIGILLGVITSIPELITFFESQRHYKKSKSNDLLGVIESTNNLLTSNILNLFIIQSIGIIIYTIVV